jgi:FkbM family methyltransferase
MKRPTLVRHLPMRLRGSAFHRIYLPNAGDRRWHSLFAGASLDLAPGITVDLLASDFMHAEIAFTGVYERLLSSRVAELGRKGGGLFADVGANIGYFSLIWAASNVINKALAFEAAPRCSKLLRRNIDRNNLSDRITAYDLALGRESGALPFDLGPHDRTGWGGVALEASDNTIDVPVKRLDDVIGEVVINLLKIDVEGADTWVLMGAERHLRAKRIKQIWYEQNTPRQQRLGIQEDEAQSFLRSVGYRVQPMTDTRLDVVDWMAVPE